MFKIEGFFVFCFLNERMLIFFKNFPVCRVLFFALDGIVGPGFFC